VGVDSKRDIVDGKLEVEMRLGRSAGNTNFKKDSVGE